MNNTQLVALRQSVRETISAGKAIAIIGWKDSNHSPVTRSLPGKKFLFFENPPNNLGQNVGFVLFTRFIQHKDYGRLKARNNCHAVALGTGMIKEIFESCKDVLALDTSVVADSVVKTNVDTVSSPGENDELLDYLTQPPKEKAEMSDMDKFVNAFVIGATITHSSGCKAMSSQNLIKVIKELGLCTTPRQLAVEGWVESMTKEGAKKAYWYKAGRLMQNQEDRGEKPLPESTAGRVEFLLSQETELQQEKDKLEVRLAEVERKLTMINAAKTMFAELELEFAKK